MNKRIPIFLLVAVLLTCMFGSCAVTPNDTSNTTNGAPAGESQGTESTPTGETDETPSVEGSIVFLTTLTSDTESTLFKKTEAFNEEFGVEVVIEGAASGNEAMNKFTTAALAGAGPDIVALDSSGWPINCASMGILRPLTERITPVLDEYLPGPIASGHYRDDYYVMPWYYNNTGLYYNKRLLAEVGIEEPPTTWEELETAIAALTDAGHKGISTRLDGYALFAFFFQADNPVIDTTGERPVVTVGNESGKEAWDYYTGFHTKYNAFPESMKEATDWDKAYTPFLQEECGFFICGDWAYANLVNRNPDLDFGITMMPKGRVNATVLGGYVLAMNNNTKNEDLAWTYMRYLTAKEQDDTMLELGRAPGRVDADTDALLEFNPYYNVFIEQANVTTARPLVINSADVDNMMIDAFQYVLFNQKTPDEALEDLAQALNDFVDDNYL